MPLRHTFARETVDGVIEEIGPLLKQHWDEIAQFPDIPLDVDFDLYRKAEADGRLRIYTARLFEPLLPLSNHRLVGYAVYQVDHPLHYQSSLQARQDVLFVSKAYRMGRLGIGLLRYADDALKADGVQVVYQHMKVAHPFGPLLERLGYDLAEYIYSRRLS